MSSFGFKMELKVLRNRLPKSHERYNMYNYTYTCSYTHTHVLVYTTCACVHVPYEVDVHLFMLCSDVQSSRVPRKVEGKVLLEVLLGL